MTDKHNKTTTIFNLLGSMSLLLLPAYVAADDVTNCINRYHQTESLCQCAVDRGQQAVVDKQQAQQADIFNQKETRFNKGVE